MNPEFGFAGGLPAGAVPSHVGPGSIALVSFQNISVIVVNKLYSGNAAGFQQADPAAGSPFTPSPIPFPQAAAASPGAGLVGWVSPPAGQGLVPNAGEIGMPVSPQFNIPTTVNYVIRNGQDNVEVGRVECSPTGDYLITSVQTRECILQFGINPNTAAGAGLAQRSVLMRLSNGENFNLSSESKEKEGKDKKHKDKPKKADKEGKEKDKDKKKDDKKQQFVLRNVADGMAILKFSRKGKDGKHLQMKVKSCSTSIINQSHGHGKDKDKEESFEVEGIGQPNSNDFQVKFKSHSKTSATENPYQKVLVVACVVGILELLPNQA